MVADRPEGLEVARARFEAAVPWGAAWLRAIERDHFQPTHFRQADGLRGQRPSWLLRARTPEYLQESFGFAPEIPFLALQGEVQAQDLKRVQDEVLRSGLRLDGNVVIVTDERPERLEQALRSLPGRGQRVAWAGREGAWPSLESTLRAQLPTYDVFEERDPVRGPQLLGRDEEVAALRTRLVRGDAVAVLGLRKVGKSSLVRAVTDWLDPASGLTEDGGPRSESSATVVWIDAEGIVEDSVDAVADEMLRALENRQRRAGLSVARPRPEGLRGLKATVEPLLDSGERVCFVFDEFDVLFEGGDGRSPMPGLSRLFRLLRAWAQQHQGQLSLVLIGRDPELLATPLLDGVTSPLLAWCVPVWLGPLREPHDAFLLRRLGRRVGLKVGHRTAVEARAWTGGHPLLLRQFGSALWDLGRSRGAQWGTDTDGLLQRADAAFLQREAVTTVARETVSLLRVRYPSALDQLVALTERASPAQGALSEGPAEARRTLLRFGLIDGDGALPRYLTWYLTHFLVPSGARAAV